jgi:hypothetical protein
MWPYKVTRAKATKKKVWHWDGVHQIAFDNIKATITRDVVLAYRDNSQQFELYTDALSKQLGAVAFFHRNLTEMQQHYSVTKIELLAIMETLNEFKGIMWGHGLKVFTDHKNPIQYALG